MKWFNRQSRLVKLLLLLIPPINWIVEIVVRWSAFFQKPGLIRLLLAIIVIFGVGLILGWVDFFWTLLFGHLVLAK